MKLELLDYFIKLDWYGFENNVLRIKFVNTSKLIKYFKDTP